MDRWNNRKVLVTGAGSGIGACIAQNLAQNGMIVIGCARNISPIEELAKTLPPGKLIPYQCDLSREDSIEEMFAWIEKTHGGTDVLVNNAGQASTKALLELTGTEMESMLKVNVVAAVLCAKFAANSMFARGVNDGHLFNINSMLGHSIVGILNFYSSTKFAVTAFTQGLRKELAAKGSGIRVTAISPGLTETNIHYNKNMMGENAEKFFSKVEALQPQDVADALIYSLSAPGSVQVYDVQLQPNIMNVSPTEYKP